jgi:hypothetical protein
MLCHDSYPRSFYVLPFYYKAMVWGNPEIKERCAALERNAPVRRSENLAAGWSWCLTKARMIFVAIASEAKPYNPYAVTRN